MKKPTSDLVGFFSSRKLEIASQLTIN